MEESFHLQNVILFLKKAQLSLQFDAKIAI